MAYIPAIDGYIVDVPNVIFTRCDGKEFTYQRLTSCNFSPTMEPIAINAGHSLYPVAYIPAGATAEVTVTSAEFRADMFEMAHNTTASEDAAYSLRRSGIFNVLAGLTVKLPDGASSPYIVGMEAGVATAAGVYTVTHVNQVAGPPIVPAHELITFHTGDVALGDDVQITYTLAGSGTKIPVSVISSSSQGALQLQYPVYSTGTDCSDSAIKGNLFLKVFKVRVTAMPGFDSSYKSALTNGVTFSVVDPQREDGSAWEWFYESLA